MSLLDAIVSKKRDLKKSETIVTYIDGKMIKVSGNNVEHLGHTIGYVIDTKPDNIPSKIIDFLYLGSQDCCEYETLKSFNIKYVLSIGVKAAIKCPDVIYNFVDCLDLPESNLDIPLRKCIPFIEDAVNKFCNILIHCNAGVSRSSSVAIAYLILVKKYDFEEAYNIVRNARSCIKPNSGFEKQLRCLK